MAELKFKPSRSYDLQLVIKGENYTSTLKNVQFATSITAPWQTVTLSLSLDPSDMLLQGGIWGQDHCELTIMLLNSDETMGEQLVFDLMVVEMNAPLKMTAECGTKHTLDFIPVEMTTVFRNSFKIMTSMVNEVYEATTVKTIIEELITNSGGTPLYDTDEQNVEVIDQIAIPPTTLLKTIKYLDYTFGLYNGVPATYCDYEGNVHVLNLSSRLHKRQIFTIYQLAEQTNNQPFIDKSQDGDYYTYSPIETHWDGNATFAVFAQTLNHIVKPKDTLYTTITQDLDTVCTTYGLASKKASGQPIPIDDNISSRKKYYIDHTGYEATEYFSNSIISKSIASLSMISIQIEKNLPILPLMNVGQPVTYEPRTLEYQEVGGRYILKSSVIEFAREGEWQTIATIQLVRTNKSE